MNMHIHGSTDEPRRATGVPGVKMNKARVESIGFHATQTDGRARQSTSRHVGLLIPTTLTLFNPRFALRLRGELSALISRRRDGGHDDIANQQDLMSRFTHS